MCPCAYAWVHVCLQLLSCVMLASKSTCALNFKLIQVCKCVFWCMTAVWNDICVKRVYSTQCHMNLSQRVWGQIYSVPLGVWLCVRVKLLRLSYQSAVNLRFKVQWIIYPGRSRVRRRVWMHIQPNLPCMHTHTHTHTHTELYSWKRYKYLSLFLHLIFISSNGARIGGVVGWWGNPERK